MKDMKYDIKENNELFYDDVFIVSFVDDVVKLVLFEEEDNLDENVISDEEFDCSFVIVLSEGERKIVVLDEKLRWFKV